MRFLVWQWGRFGSGPRIATLLAEGLRALPESEVLLSLSTGAEILRCSNPPVCDLPVVTYEGTIGFLVRVAGALFSVRALVERIRRLAPEVAVCAQPAPLDLVMARALDVLRVPFIVLVHDADYHPGDGLPMQMWLQRMLCRRAAALGALSTHVGERLKAQGLADTPARPLLRLRLPPIGFPMPPRCPRQNARLRLLMFGRLLPYKGLDLLGEALSLLGSRPGLEVRVVGAGKEATVEFYVKEPPPNGQRETLVGQLGLNFYAVPKGTAVSFFTEKVAPKGLPDPAERGVPSGEPSNPDGDPKEPAIPPPGSGCDVK